MLRYLIKKTNPVCRMAIVPAVVLSQAAPVLADPADYPLLGSSRGGSPLYDFCQGKDPSTPLPPDPRSLVQPGVSDGKAVYFNAYWNDCHIDPELVGGRENATTCGELEEYVQEGYRIMMPGNVESGLFFSGDNIRSISAGFGMFSISAEDYNNLWKAWGFDERPDNFDQLVAEKYGTGFKEGYNNPYPLPGEDPNKTNGGSGQLPFLFAQAREKDGDWTGRISFTCHSCHSAPLGTAEDGEGLGFVIGTPGTLLDPSAFAKDMLGLGSPIGLGSFISLNKTRGRSNASDVNLAFFAPDQMEGVDTLYDFWGLLTSGSTGDMDPPAYWNLGHRPLKFVDGIFSAGGDRVDLVFYAPIISFLTGYAQDWMSEHGQSADDWITTLKAPEYPFEINTALAQAGAVLFHNKDLWAEGLNNPVKRPAGGNGSCASCHGAYSPRYVNDPNFLADPALEGMASYIVPKDIIGTDPDRVDVNGDAVQNAGSLSYFGYPETIDTENDCTPQSRPGVRGDREYGYLAPPLYGVWATSPYFHNGSVPNLLEVLKPSERKPIWKRVSTPARPDQEGMVVMGFDTDLNRAFDQDKVGWRYDEVTCDSMDWLVPGNRINIDCDPDEPGRQTGVQRTLSGLSRSMVGLWNILYPPVLSDKHIEARKIVNTGDYGMSNKGHDFTSVLSDAETQALIEYMKTL